MTACIFGGQGAAWEATGREPGGAAERGEQGRVRLINKWINHMHAWRGSRRSNWLSLTPRLAPEPLGPRPPNPYFDISAMIGGSCRNLRRQIKNFVHFGWFRVPKTDNKLLTLAPLTLPGREFKIYGYWPPLNRSILVFPFEWCRFYRI